MVCRLREVRVLILFLLLGAGAAFHIVLPTGITSSTRHRLPLRGPGPSPVSYLCPQHDAADAARSMMRNAVRRRLSISCQSRPDERVPRWRPQLKKPVLVLVGKPGIGKRALASSLSRRLGVEFFDGRELSHEAEAVRLTHVCKDAENADILATHDQTYGVSAVAISSAGTISVRQALQRAKEHGHLVVHVHPVTATAQGHIFSTSAKAPGDERDTFDQTISSHRFCLLECVPGPSVAASGARTPSLAQQQWDICRNRELAVEELHAMVHRLVFPPCPLVLGSIVEPVDPRVLRAPTRPVSLVAELRADVWLDAWQRAAGKAEGKSKQDLEAALLTSFALARRWLDCPVLWVVRSVGQGGFFAGQADEVTFFRLLGIRAGAATCRFACLAVSLACLTSL